MDAEGTHTVRRRRWVRSVQQPVHIRLDGAVDAAILVRVGPVAQGHPQVDDLAVVLALVVRFCGGVHLLCVRKAVLEVV